MNIEIAAVGKVKEPFLEEAVREYARRLSGYCSLKINEVQDEKTKEALSAREKEQILAAEASRLSKHLKNGRNTYTVALCIDGREYSSEGFAEHIKELMNSGTSTLRFVIGGSLGLHREISEGADERMSFGRLTFPHQLMRVILAEQIYRAFRIINGEPYHK